jgi:hypothetical protein
VAAKKPVPAKVVAAPPATKRKPPAKRKTAPRARRLGAVETALCADLAVIRAASPELADSALAATALAMAREIDKPRNSATSKSMCAARLTDALEQLRALTPPAEESDDVDDLKRRRAERRAAATA